LGLLVLAWALVSCEERQEFPQPLAISAPPKPFNLTVTSPAPQQYDLAWEISDPAAVKIYRIYLVSYGPPELVGTSETPSYLAETVFPISGLVFGVSAVSIENVESDLATAVAP
jgi:hypothetical protein